MGVPLSSGFTINSRDEADDRLIYATVNGCLVTGEMVNGIAKPFLAYGRRHVGMAVYIQSENRTYRFIGSIANEDFVPVADGGEPLLGSKIAATVDAGGVKTGDSIAAGTPLTEVWKRLLDPAAPPVIVSFTAEPDEFGLKEVGEAISSVTLTVEVEKGENDIRSVHIISLPDTLLTEDLSITDSGTVSITDSVGMDQGIREYRCLVEDVKGITQAAYKKFEFVCPAYTGSVNTATPAVPVLQALDKHLVNKSNVAHSYTHIGKRMCGCFPVEWGMPIAIRDDNGNDYLALFTHTVQEFTLGLHDVDYNVFVYSMANMSDEFQLTFQFK